MAKDIQTISLLDLLPSSITADAKAKQAALAIDAELRKATSAIKSALLISRIDELPEPVIDLLAWQWHVDFYDAAILTLEKKRQLIKQSLAWHRIKGTPAAVEQMISTVYAETSVIEWFEYGGQPYHFRIRSEAQETDSDGIARLKRMVFASKNVRSLLDGIDFVFKPVDDLSNDLNDDNFKIGVGLTFEESIYLGALCYRKPVFIGNRHNGINRRDGSIAYDSRYTADISYGDPASPELYYDEGDAAKLYISYDLNTFKENYAEKTVYHNARARHNGAFRHSGTGNTDYDGGLSLRVERQGGATETIKL